MSSLSEKLAALSREVEVEEKPERGGWLRQQLEQFKLQEGITEDTEPTGDLIRRQVCLPKFESEEERRDFKDPILQWEVVTGEEKQLLPPSWDRKNLPEVEILEPPEPPVIDPVQLLRNQWLEWIQPGAVIPKEEFLNNNDKIRIPTKEEVLNNPDLDDITEIAAIDGGCVIRTTKRSLRKFGGNHGNSGHGGDRGGRQERAPGPGDYRGRDRSRSPRYRQRLEQGDRSHGSRQERSHERRDSRSSYGHRDSRDYRGESSSGRSYGRRDMEVGFNDHTDHRANSRKSRGEQSDSNRPWDSRGESSRERSYGSHGREYQAGSRTPAQERGGQLLRQVKQEEDPDRSGGRAELTGHCPRQVGPSGQVQVKQESGGSTTAGEGKKPQSYKEYKEMKNKKF